MSFRSFPLLGAVVLVLLGMSGLSAAQMTRVPPSPASSDRAGAEAQFRRIDGDLRMTLRSCAVARSPVQQCACHRQLERQRVAVQEARQETTNVLEMLYILSKKSSKEQNEDKKYYLEKLKQYNDMSKRIKERLGRASTETLGHCSGAGVPGLRRDSPDAGQKQGRRLPHGPKSLETARAPMEQNIDRPGADYHNFAVPGNDPARCRNACAGDGRCKAWTFGRPGVRGSTGHCWLKFRIPPPRRDRCCVSGVK